MPRHACLLLLLLLVLELPVLLLQLRDLLPQPVCIRLAALQGALQLCYAQLCITLSLLQTATGKHQLSSDECLRHA